MKSAVFKLGSALVPSSCNPKCFKLKDSSWTGKCCTAEGSLRISHKPFLAHLTNREQTPLKNTSKSTGLCLYWWVEFSLCSQFVVYQFCQGRRVIVSSWGIISEAKHIREEESLSCVLPFPVTSWENNYCVWVTNDWDKMRSQCV